VRAISAILAIRNLLKIAHTATAAAFVLHQTRIGKSAMTKLRINCQ
jgi:hypothetical protein